MKIILFGGLSQDHRQQLEAAFRSSGTAFETMAPASPQELGARLREGGGDLLLVDLDAPQGAGLAMLAKVAEQRASLPILAVGSAPSPNVQDFETRFPGMYFPLVNYLKKPVPPTQLVAAVESELRQATWGVIQGLSLPGLLQMLNMERKTCTIRVSSLRRQGFFYLREGQIINARYRRLEGLEAVQRLINAESPKVEIDSRLHDSTQRIDLCVEEILMMAAQFQDETLGGLQPADGNPEESDAIPAVEIGKWGHPAPLPPPAAQPKPRHRLWLVAAALLLSMGAAGWFLLPRQVELKVESSPAGASVQLDGQPLGQTPLALKRPAPLSGTLVVEQNGFQREQHVLRPDERNLSFALKPLPVPPAAEPAPAPEPAAETPAPAPAPPAPKSPKAKGKPTPPPSGDKRDIFDQLRKGNE